MNAVTLALDLAARHLADRPATLMKSRETAEEARWHELRETALALVAGVAGAHPGRVELLTTRDVTACVRMSAKTLLSRGQRRQTGEPVTIAFALEVVAPVLLVSA